MTRLRLAPIVLLLSALVSGCGDDVETVTSASAAPGSVNLNTRLFAGTIAPRGAAFYSFTVPQDSGVFVTLASLTTVGTRAALATPLVLGLGVPRGTGCATTSTLSTAPDLAAQLREWRSAGVHCVSLVDPGNLAADAGFAIRIGYYQ